MIVRDEADVLEPCLASIRDAVDDIVVVDTGSTDQSPDIARAFGARVYRQAWTHDFSAARNAALDHVDSEWVLYIDADERLAPTSRAAIENLLAGAPEIAFRLLLRPRVGWTPYREYRLWRNDPRIRFDGVIHEKVVPSIHAVATAERRPIGVCDLLLEHVGYEGDQTAKHWRNLPLLRRQVAVEPGNLFAWHHLASVLAALGEPDEAERALTNAVAVARERDFVDPTGVLAMSQLISMRLSRGETVELLLAEARNAYPANWLLVWLEGRVLTAAGQFDAALDRFNRLVGVDRKRLPEDGPAYEERLFGELAHDARGLCLFRLGRYRDAALAYAAAALHSLDDRGYSVKRELALARCARADPAPELSGIGDGSAQ
jgi:tetratricopeptide (TPR) repeat protein